MGVDKRTAGPFVFAMAWGVYAAYLMFTWMNSDGSLYKTRKTRSEQIKLMSELLDNEDDIKRTLIVSVYFFFVAEVLHGIVFTTP